MWVIIALLFVVILVLGYFLVATPAPVHKTPVATSTTDGVATTTNTGTSDVTVITPQSGASVPKKFTVTGSAPGTWYFEASFPIEVRTLANTVVGTGHATALTDWMTTAQVAFKADMTVSGYSGPAILVLKRDNPSGLPQNDASTSIPIVIQ